MKTYIALRFYLLVLIGVQPKHKNTYWKTVYQVLIVVLLRIQCFRFFLCFGMYTTLYNKMLKRYIGTVYFPFVLHNVVFHRFFRQHPIIVSIFSFHLPYYLVIARSDILYVYTTIIFVDYSHYFS